MVLVVKNLPTTVGDVRDAGLIPGLGKSSGEGHGNPLQYPTSILAWRILECIAMPFPRGSSPSSGGTCVSYVSCIRQAGSFTASVTWEAHLL